MTSPPSADESVSEPSASVSLPPRANPDRESAAAREAAGREVERRLAVLLAVLRPQGDERSAISRRTPLRWSLRRWTPKHIWYRARLPRRRRRWARERIAQMRGFEKDPKASWSDGPALVFGEFSGGHGLARAAAYDLERVRALHSVVTAIDIGPYVEGHPPEAISVGHPIENVYFLCQPDNYGLICRLMKPADIAGAWRSGRWVWETPHFPHDWRMAEAFVHEVRAPSEFCAATFRAALRVPVTVEAHAVTPLADPGIDMRALLGVAKDAFMGLAIMDIVSCPERKNPWAHVRAWRKAFDDDPNAVLVMKLRVGKRSRVVLKELRDLIGGASNIILVSDDLSSDEIGALHHAADLYLSLHRAEGFGLGIFEALLLGRKVVATDWSANAEYGPAFANYVPIPARLVPYRDWTAHYADAAFEWADV
jgi:hypothetical protein